MIAWGLSDVLKFEIFLNEDHFLKLNKQINKRSKRLSAPLVVVETAEQLHEEKAL